MQIIKEDGVALGFLTKYSTPRFAVKVTNTDMAAWLQDINATILYLAALADTVPHRGTIDGHIKRLQALRNQVQDMNNANKVTFDDTKGLPRGT